MAAVWTFSADVVWADVLPGVTDSLELSVEVGAAFDTRVGRGQSEGAFAAPLS